MKEKLLDYFMAEKGTALVVAPHGDDEILGAGGAIHLLLSLNWQVFIVYATYGDASCPEYLQNKFSDIRRKETISGVKGLGVKEKHLFFLPEIYSKDSGGVYPPPLETGGFYPLRLNERLLTHYLMKVIRIVKPSTIFIPHQLENHPDHRIVSQCSIGALRFAPGKWFREYKEKIESFTIDRVLGYEVDHPIPPEDMLILDISDHLENKIAALKQHSTQSIEWYQKRMTTRTQEIGRKTSNGSAIEIFSRLK
jgi:LmbE family N-acetylglucosaminyl deacetylase